MPLARVKEHQDILRQKGDVAAEEQELLADGHQRAETLDLP